jgi:hypothetical protein
MTTQEAKQKVLAILSQRYPDYATKKAGERVLLAMSVLANDIKVREVGGNNRGPWVSAIMTSTGLSGNMQYNWCAASIEFACEVAGVTIGPGDPNSARVAQWRSWASSNNRLSNTPARGRLCLFVREDGTGHIGIVAQVLAGGKLRTYEGNTSAGKAGSQSDGGGLYERVRDPGFFSRFVDLD